MNPEIVKAVILARGLGTRMRRADSAAALDAEQASVADTGVKALIPVGRAFLDYVLSGLADAGYREVCLVIGPEHNELREHYANKVLRRRLAIQFAIQEKPLGTADAVAAAESFAGADRFLMLNSDNYYPVAALRALRALGGPGLAAFERDALVRESNIPVERVRQYAVLRISEAGELQRIVEKPEEETIAAMGPEIWVSMNLWAFGPAIFRACASVKPSVRGELELQDAVQYAMDSLGERFRVVKFREGVLDLSTRSDVAGVKERLKDVRVEL